MVDSKQQWKAWLYLLPAIILLLIFTAWPIVNTLRMAFTVRWDPELPVEYEIVEEVITIMDEYGEEIEVVNKKEIPVKWGGYTTYKISESISGDYDYEFGLANFKAVINYDGFWLIMQNTVLLCVLTVPLSTFLALLIAVCLNAIKPLRRLLQTIFFLPYVTNSIAIGMVFAAMFNIVGVNTGDIAASTSVGIINTVIGWFGMDPINWINQGSTYWANMLVMIIYIVWNALPFKILILLGGLQSVNKQYYDAAKIDSTPKWRVFTRITVPLLSPMIAYVVITGFIGGFKEYTSIVGIFGEGMQPPGASVGTPRLQTMVGYIYDNLGNAEGIASAAALLLFLLIFAVTLVNLAVSKKKTHY
ncbi:MAG: sugar ABC transporter permease [Clostridia bacterium]|nr:sugar ABC transporter permease [Clostridia bacterium]